MSYFSQYFKSSGDFVKKKKKVPKGLSTYIVSE